MLDRFLSLFVHGPISATLRRSVAALLLMVLASGGFAVWKYSGFFGADPQAGPKPTRSWNGGIKVVDDCLRKIGVKLTRESLKIDDVSEVTLVDHNGTKCWMVTYCYHYQREYTVGASHIPQYDTVTKRETFFIQNDVIVGVN